MRLEEVRQNHGLFLTLGFALAALGVLAIAFSLIAALATAVVLGIVLMIGGLAQCAEAVYSGRFSGFLFYLLGGTLYFFIGLIMVSDPLRGALGLAFVVGVLFLAGGFLRIVLALQTRHFSDWAWRLFSGIVSVLLGLVILARGEENPGIVGILIGLDLLFSGWMIVMLALTVRNLPPQAGP
jgi:uncharacterized membrane protein HdeD (DUF308 family)